MKKRTVFYKALVLFFTLANFSGAVLSKQASAEFAQPIISAVQITGGEGKTSQDYIELFNPNSEAFNLKGYKLVKRSQFGVADVSIKSFSTDVFIPAYSFYLWANSSYMEIPSTPDSTTTSTLAENNGVALRFGSLDSGELITSLSWGDTNNGFMPTGLGNPSANQSIAAENLFKEPVYQVSNSNPRNSTNQLLPELIEDPIQVDPPILQDGEDGSVAGQDGILTDIQSGNTEDAESNPENSEPDDLGDQSEVIEEVPDQEITEIIGVEPEGPESTEDVVEMEEQVQTEIIIKISEVLPNPKGVDAGQESVELYNAGLSEVDLAGWVLDDIDGYGDLSSNALRIEDALLGSGEYLNIILPKGKFTLNNSTGDLVTLFNKVGVIQDQVVYSGSAVEGKSYSLINDEWFWVAPSLGEINPEEVSNDDTEEESDSDENLFSLEGVLISEVYPSPNKGQDEFIELYNSTSESINLSGGILRIGNKEVSLPNFLLSPSTYYAIFGKSLKVPLANSGKNIQLISNEGEVLDEVVYGKALVGQSYSLLDSKYEWTTTVTPIAANVLTKPVIQESQKNSQKLVLNKDQSTKKAQPKSTVTKKPSNSSTSKTTTSYKSEESGKNIPTNAIEQPNHSNKDFDFKGIIAIAVATLGAGGLALYRFGI